MSGLFKIILLVLINMSVADDAQETLALLSQS